jgi:hypothetical protein
MSTTEPVGVAPARPAFDWRNHVVAVAVPALAAAITVAAAWGAMTSHQAAATSEISDHEARLKKLEVAESVTQAKLDDVKTVQGEMNGKLDKLVSRRR